MALRSIGLIWHKKYLQAQVLGIFQQTGMMQTIPLKYMLLVATAALLHQRLRAAGVVAVAGMY
jgi:hypothetical protein